MAGRGLRRERRKKKKKNRQLYGKHFVRWRRLQRTGRGFGGRETPKPRQRTKIPHP